MSMLSSLGVDTPVHLLRIGSKKWDTPQTQLTLVYRTWENAKYADAGGEGAVRGSYRSEW